MPEHDSAPDVSKSQSIPSPSIRSSLKSRFMLLDYARSWAGSRNWKTVKGIIRHGHYVKVAVTLTEE